jgi:hypothetical protein
MAAEQVKIEVFVPAAFVAAVREALHEAGAARIGNYDHCGAVSQVTGYWRPLEGAHPAEGTIGLPTEAPLCKLELRCDRALAAQAVRAIRAVHPFEEPVINVIPLLTVE